MSAAIELKVNGENHHLDVDPGAPLLQILRNDLGLKAAKFGCGLEQCGACKVLVDGQAVPSRAEICEALAVHICRCGTHNRIICARCPLHRSASKPR